MKQEEILRQEAIRLHLQGMSAILIASQLNRTRQWVYKWLKKHEESSGTDWYKSPSNAPKHVLGKTDKTVEQAVVEIRCHLLSQPYAQRGAIAIMYEFERLGLKPPSIATINRNEVFVLNPALKYSYVIAEVILDKYVLVVSQNVSIHHIFPFAMSLP